MAPVASPAGQKRAQEPLAKVCPGTAQNTPALVLRRPPPAVPGSAEALERGPGASEARLPGDEVAVVGAGGEDGGLPSGAASRPERPEVEGMADLINRGVRKTRLASSVLCVLYIERSSLKSCVYSSIHIRLFYEYPTYTKSYATKNILGKSISGTAFQ